jgi:hypothetical protein
MVSHLPLHGSMADANWLTPLPEASLEGVVQGRGRRILVYLIIGRRKIIICKLNDFILVFNILTTLSLIDLHPLVLPDGHTTSLYCRTIFGWLLCENSSVRGHLRPQCISFSFIFGCSIQCPKRWYHSSRTPPACRTSSPYSSLLRTPIFGGCWVEIHWYEAI